MMMIGKGIEVAAHDSSAHQSWASGKSEITSWKDYVVKVCKALMRTRVKSSQDETGWGGQ